MEQELKVICMRIVVVLYWKSSIYMQSTSTSGIARRRLYECHESEWEDYAFYEAARVTAENSSENLSFLLTNTFISPNSRVLSTFV